MKTKIPLLTNKMQKPIIFLDFDGVLNCEIHFLEDHVTNANNCYDDKLSKRCINLLNDLCTSINADVVVSSSWRKNKSVEQLQKILNDSGAIFNVIGKTPTSEDGIRGVEIWRWLKENRPFNFDRYVILDDESDMLLWQTQNFFKCDPYCGLTPNICYRIKLFIDSFAI